ncbi:glycosyltransferase family 2 protein [Rheinheimera tangshanensis]|uniref:Glycosyltransferase n=1 Tax=Rheinheimera tangshanensis TaxID=400153 RepID=A0A5C8LWN3_9GAMM|nr:glycosyltransferase [Rheinheimera tangshanensis]TXK80493.1 glycosyltransferase [Rheinheimera tangshanensis]GGM60875.1 hypothetical protein GCM10010920_21930 [Rheinheimera tangshanensis]
MSDISPEIPCVLNDSNNYKTVTVSIICLTYNHERYITQAVQSFLAQKTNFDYEIIIHDDASNDRTAEVLKNLQAQFPDRVRLIIQTENQYSKFGFSRVLKTALDAASGEYFAFCEGDDYWCDDSKLQVQVDVLKQTGVGMCFHPAAELKNDEILIPDTAAYSNKFYSASDLIRKNFHFVQTSSIVFSRRALNHLSYDIISRSPVADVIIRIAATFESGAIAVPLVGSVYRIMSEGSWSSTMRKKDVFLTYIRKMLLTIDELNNFYSQKLSSDFEYYKYMFVMAVVRDFDVSLKDKLSFVGSLNTKYKAYCYLSILLRQPKIHVYIRKVIATFNGKFSK